MSPDDENESEKAKRRTLAKYMQYSYVGLQFFLSIGIFTGGGIWLDRRLGTVVLFTLVGLGLGFGGGLYSLYREFILPSATETTDKPREKNGPEIPGST